jgi:hypothetical protein
MAEPECGASPEKQTQNCHASPDGQAEILLTTYQIERQDTMNSAVLNTAVLGAGLAFVLATTPFLGSQRGPDHLPDWLLLGAAVPVWTLTGLLIYQGAASRLRMGYILHLESELSSDRTYPRFVALNCGLFSSGGLRHNLIYVSHAIITAISPLLIAGLYTVFVMVNVASNIDARTVIVIIYAIIYGTYAFLNAAILLRAGQKVSLRRHHKFDEWAGVRLSEHQQNW